MQQQASQDRPLSGVTIVDMTHVLSGPFATMILADMGARVIKIERRGGGDDARGFGPFLNTAEETVSGYFFSINRSKESIALDLKSSEDLELLRKMLAKADIVVENFKPGAMDRLGLGWEALSQAYPKLVMCSVSGFGQNGPYHALPAYDMVVQAMGGVMSLTGPEGGPPVRVGTSVGDLTAGLYAVIGMLGALYERNRTGRGSYVDISMLDVQAAMLENAIARYQIEGTVPAPLGSRHPALSPFAAYRAKDGMLVIAIGTDAMFARLCDVLGWPEGYTSSHFRANADRLANSAELTAQLERCLQAHTVDEWLERMRHHDIPCGPLSNVEQVLRDPQLRARDMLVDLPATRDVKLTVAGSPLRLVGRAGPDYRPAPRFDEHREALLAEFGVPASETNTEPPQA